MGMKKANKAFLAFCALFLCCTCTTASADTSILNMFRRKLPTGDAETLALRAEHGPWLILAATISGESSEAQAVKLANEIRTEMKLPAFILKKSLDDKGVLGSTQTMVTEVDGSTTNYRAWRQYANPQKGLVYAVLVGEFTSTEDPRIEGLLNKIRYATPEALAEDGQTTDGPDSSWMVKRYRSVMRSRTDRQAERGPMSAAFVTKNPMLPADFFQGPAIDSFVEKLNKRVKYSLLDCPGRFTVRVATFQGKTGSDMLNHRIDDSDEISDSLDHAALRANRLTTALREKGVEAYEFHDRYGSYVMIGSFDELGSETEDKGFQYNPQMIKIVNEYCGYRNIEGRDARTGAQVSRTTVNSLDKIPFDLEGKPMAVPKRSTSGIYGGSLMGR